MGNISKNLSSVEFISAASVAKQRKNRFEMSKDFNHEAEDCTLALCYGGEAKDYPMVVFMFANGKRPVAVAALPDELFVAKGKDLKLAATSLRVSFKNGECVLEK